MEPLDRQATLDLARAFVAEQGGKLVHAIICAQAVIDADARESAYQARIVALQDDLASVTASCVENATRYAADLAAEERAGAAAVERIRAAIVAGGDHEEQQWATAEAIEETRQASHVGHFYRMSRAFLAMSASHTEARATLRTIGDLALAGKAP